MIFKMNKEATFKDPKDGQEKNVYIQPKDKKALSKREKEIVGLVGKGLTSSEIGKELGISTRTVDAHRSNAMQKTGALNGAHLVAMYYEEKLKQIAMAVTFVNNANKAGKAGAHNLPNEDRSASMDILTRK